VIIILAVLTGGLLAILHDAGVGLRQFGTARSREMIAGAMELGVNEAMQAIQRMDPEVLIRSSADTSLPGGRWNIFENWGRDSFVCNDGNYPCMSGTAPMFYPLTGPNANELSVRVGLALGQRTQPPAGEDVNNAYGYVLEIQVAVSKAGDNPDAAERAIHAIRVPNVISHSN
jgi:hypothetical protein